MWFASTARSFKASVRLSRAHANVNAGQRDTIRANIRFDEEKRPANGACTSQHSRECGLGECRYAYVAGGQMTDGVKEGIQMLGERGGLQIALPCRSLSERSILGVNSRQARVSMSQCPQSPVDRRVKATIDCVGDSGQKAMGARMCAKTQSISCQKFSRKYGDDIKPS